MKIQISQIVNKVFLVLLLLAVVSCNKKSVELPQIAISGVSKIKNHSQIWIFYNQNKDSIWTEVNMKNKINSTHWILNIDKRLSMGQLLPNLQEIISKRNAEGMHSKKGSKLFLSYSDILDKKIALTPIDSTRYVSKTKKDFMNYKKDTGKVFLYFSRNSVYTKGTEYTKEQWKTTKLDSLAEKKIHLFYAASLSYQEYMDYRLSIQQKMPKEELIDNTETLVFE